MKRKYYLLVGFVFFAVSSLFSQTTLTAGDIAILQYNSDAATEVIKFMAMRSMESGTTIHFTDNGWTGTALRTTEGTDTWTAATNIKCGDIITFTLSNIDLGTSGDQLIAYQGSTGSEVFLFALNNQGSSVWQTGSTNEEDSALPTGLTNGTNAVALDETDNAKYNGVAADRRGNKTFILDNICDDTKWRRSNSNNQDFARTFTSIIRWTTFWDVQAVTGETGLELPEDYFLVRIRQDYTTAIQGEFNACELEVRSGKTLTISSGNEMNVENGIDNLGTIIVEDDASLVQETSDGPNTGTGYTVERQTTTLAEKGDFTYWSSPLSSSTLADVAIAQRYFSFTSSTQNWTTETSFTPLVPGVGYAVTGPTSGSYPLLHTASFTGSAINNGDISVVLGYSDDGDATNDANFFGNPYPSAIDADAFLAANTNIGGTLYFWTHNTADSEGDNTIDDYVSWNGTGGVGSCTGCTAPDGNIASGQGFFGQAIASGSVTFTNAMRVSGNNALFYKGGKKKKENSNERDRIWLNFKNDNGGFSQALLGFIPEATDGIDRLYDGESYGGVNDLSFYSILEDGNFVIQGKSTLKNEEKIPLGVASKVIGNFKIEVDHTEGALKNSQIILYDKELDVQHNLMTGAYNFNIDVIGENNNRFDLLISSNREILSTPNIEDELSKKLVRVFIRKDVLRVKSKEKIKGVKIYDLQGTLIAKMDKDKKRYKLKIGELKIVIVEIRFASGDIIRQKVIHQN